MMTDNNLAILIDFGDNDFQGPMKIVAELLLDFYKEQSPRDAGTAYNKDYLLWLIDYLMPAALSLKSPFHFRGKTVEERNEKIEYDKKYLKSSIKVYLGDDALKMMSEQDFFNGEAVFITLSEYHHSVHVLP